MTITAIEYEFLNLEIDSTAHNYMFSVHDAGVGIAVE
jgi:hypothetical protein